MTNLQSTLNKGLSYEQFSSVSFKKTRVFALFPVLLLASGIAGAPGATAPEYTFTTFAGLRESGAGFFDGQGSAARFRFPSGTIADKSGNVYVADYGNHTIRK